MKIRFFTILFLLASPLLFANQSFGALDGGSSFVPTSSSDSTSTTNSSASSAFSPYKNFSQRLIGAGLELGIRFNLTEDIFTDFENKNSKKKDHIFTEIGAFGNKFLSGEVKQNFGGQLNLGYEIRGVRFYGLGGYVVSAIDYKETENNKQSISASSPFIGAGLGYDITKNISARINSMFYKFDFKPKNSEFKSVEINVSAVNFALALHF